MIIECTQLFRNTLDKMRYHHSKQRNGQLILLQQSWTGILRIIIYCLELKGKAGMVVLKNKQTRVLRDNQHIHGTSLHLLFST